MKIIPLVSESLKCLVLFYRFFFLWGGDQEQVSTYNYSMSSRQRFTNLSGHLLPEQIRGAGGSRSSSLEPLSPSEGIEEAVLDPEI